MEEADIANLKRALERIRAQAENEEFRLTQHAQQEMIEDGITLDNILEAISNGQILENYPEHKRGACCLVGGVTRGGRSVHIVCTTARPVLIIVTVYEPKPPKWESPTQRRP